MSENMPGFIDSLKAHLTADYAGMYREAGEALAYPFLTPGSEQYADVLWDWDSWWSNIALRQVLAEVGDAQETERAEPYERGCILNYLEFSRQAGIDGWIPIVVGRGGCQRPEDIYAQNMHKPCLAQHAAFLIQQAHGEAEWLREGAYVLQCFVNNYRNHHRHAETGLYFWQDDTAIGVDNDPCTFGRPPRSSGSIYLNCLMYRELLALAYILDQLNQSDIGDQYRADAEHLKAAINEHCWDPRDGFYYSVDLNLTPNRPREQRIHVGQLRDWPCLIQRIGVWSGFLGLWAGVADEDQARRVAQEHYRNERTFGCVGGVRTLSAMEKMYNLRASGNPSSWLGPVWGIANYMTWRGLVRYGLDDDARDLCDKTISLFGRDLERFGALHEYYLPDNAEPVLNPGFQNWNYLVLNMIAWREGRSPVTEF